MQSYGPTRLLRVKTYTGVFIHAFSFICFFPADGSDEPKHVAENNI